MNASVKLMVGTYENSENFLFKRFLYIQEKFDLSKWDLGFFSSRSIPWILEKSGNFVHGRDLKFTFSLGVCRSNANPPGAVVHRI